MAMILSVLQKKGRLIDFLQEDISGFNDNQVGAAVRNIHKDCKEALEKHLIIEPVMKEKEGEGVVIQEGFDPSAIRLTGNVVGSPPFKGSLKHGGWRISSVNLPEYSINQDKSVIEPAEFDVS